ncbi:MAG: Lsa36 family surface (lipo)protein [Bacteriovoracaceae bacterium]
MKKKLTLFALATLISLPAHSQLFKIKITDFGNLDSSPALKAALEAEIAKAEADINKDLPSGDTRRLMEGMADSSAIAGKGIGSDYASGMEVFLIGAGVGVGADLEKDKQTDSDLSGVGVSPGIIIGANLGFMDAQKILGLETNKLNIYLSGMSYGLDRKMGDGDKDQIEADLTSLGFHVSYDWIKGSGSKLFGWGGVKLHTGYEYNSSKFSFTSTINEQISAESGGITLSGNAVGKPNAEIEVTTHSIPIEISSSVQFLYILSMYGGLGVDFNFGEAKGSGALNADETTLNCTGAGCGAIGTVKVQPSANIDGNGKVTPMWGRAFLGLQINLPYTRIFVQADKPVGNEVIGATAGLRFVY